MESELEVFLKWDRHFRIIARPAYLRVCQNPQHRATSVIKRGALAYSNDLILFFKEDYLERIGLKRLILINACAL